MSLEATASFPSAHSPFKGLKSPASHFPQPDHKAARPGSYQTLSPPSKRLKVPWTRLQSLTLLSELGLPSLGSASIKGILLLQEVKHVAHGWCWEGRKGSNV